MNGCKRACLPISIQPSCRDELLAGEVIKAWRELSSRRKPQPSWNAGQHESRDTKSQNFSVGRISRAKTFRMECVNRVRDIYAPKVRKSLSQHTTFRTFWKLSRLSGNFSHCLEVFQTVQNFSDCPETFHTVQNFPNCPEIFHTVPKLSSLSGNFLDRLETFQTILKLSRLS